MAFDEVRQDRLKKLEKIKQAGVDPYPSSTNRKNSVNEARNMMGQTVCIAGRIMSYRDMGKITFIHLEDESGKIQLFFAQTELSEEPYKFIRNLDIGDFLQAQGEIFTTQAGEISVRVKNYQLLSKNIRPIPSEFFGLKDTEERLRKRYLDLILNPDLRELFRLKAKFWASVRNYLLKDGGLEVETPVLSPIAGGADARPFITHMNALDIDLYLRISPELYLKRLLVGGYEKVFEIGRIFRNEGIDDEHLQDYAQMEMYWAYKDYEWLMDFVQDMTQTVIEETFGTLKTKWKGQEIDWSGNWPRIDYTQLLNEKWGADTEKMSVEELYELAKKLNVEVESNLGKGRLLDYLYKKTIRPNLIQPMYLINHPVEVEPLAKRLETGSGKVQRMQILAMGSELGKGFSELNDPIDQRERFDEQMKLRAAGDDEAQMMDEDYVEALEYGMPPAAGFAYSERLFAMLVDRPVRECVFFPLMRPESRKTTKQDFGKKMAVVLKNDLGSWQLTNIVGHITAFLGNKMSNPFDTGANFTTKDGKLLPRNSQYAVVSLSANSNQLKDLAQKVKVSGLLYIIYVSEMIETTDDKKLEKMLAEKEENQIEILGIGIFGSKDHVDLITKGLELWK